MCILIRDLTIVEFHRSGIFIHLKFLHPSSSRPDHDSLRYFHPFPSNWIKFIGDDNNDNDPETHPNAAITVWSISIIYTC
jgi:hypothetical protein